MNTLKSYNCNIFYDFENWLLISRQWFVSIKLFFCIVQWVVYRIKERCIIYVCYISKTHSLLSIYRFNDCFLYESGGLSIEFGYSRGLSPCLLSKGAHNKWPVQATFTTMASEVVHLRGFGLWIFWTRVPCVNCDGCISFFTTLVLFSSRNPTFLRISFCLRTRILHNLQWKKTWSVLILFSV